MINAAKHHLGSHGLTVSFDHLRYEDIIRDADVSRTSVYRRWAYKEDFYRELLVELAHDASPGNSSLFNGALVASLTFVKDHAADLSTATGRRGALVGACRVGADHHIAAVAGGNHWQTYVAVAATVGSIDDDLQRRAQRAQRTREDQQLDHLVDFYDLMFPLVGYRVRPGMDTRTLAILASSAIQGVLLQATYSPDLTEESRIHADPFTLGETHTWSPGALAFTSVVDSFCEPDTHHTHRPADVDLTLTAALAHYTDVAETLGEEDLANVPAFPR